MLKPSAKSPALSKPQPVAQASATGIPGGDDREFLFTDQDFERIRKLIYERAGISLSPIKRDMVYSRVAQAPGHGRPTRFPPLPLGEGKG